MPTDASEENDTNLRQISDDMTSDEMHLWRSADREMTRDLGTYMKLIIIMMMNDEIRR